jgi:DNA-binding MarR family transcriptional regulator
LTALAAQLNISKAAVSKFVAKLVRSGYLIKSRPVDNDREVIFSLTKKGQTAAVGHEQFEEKTFGPFFQLETALPEQEKKIIKEYFKKLISIAEQ